MLLGLHELKRDNLMRPDTFGYGLLAYFEIPPNANAYDIYSKELYVDMSHDWCIELGMQLNFNYLGDFLPLYRSTELIRNKKTFLIERYYYCYENKLYPYRVKYRGDHLGDDLYVQNIYKFHKKLNYNNHITASDPITHLLADAMLHEGLHIRNSKLEPLYNLFDQDKCNNYFVPHVSETGEIENRFNSILMDSECGTFNVKGSNIPNEDTLTLNYSEGDVPVNVLGRRINTIGKNHVGDPGNALDINNVEHELWSGKWHSVSSLLDSLDATDIDVSYILLNNKIDSLKINLAIDRYSYMVSSFVNNKKICNTIAHKAFQIFHPDNHNNKTIVELRIQKTFNDEAILTFSDHRTKEHFKSIYIDLALLALCGHGVLLI